MDEIQRLRARIDGIDQEIALLLKSRNEDARLLGRIKRIRGMPLQDPKRERTILDRMISSSASKPKTRLRAGGFLDSKGYGSS